MILAIALALAPQASAYARLSDAQFCDVIQTAMEFIETPMALTSAARLESTSANCEDRTVVWNVTMLEEGAALSSEERDAILSRSVCRSPVLAIVVGRGWRVRQQLTLPSGERMEREVASC